MDWSQAFSETGRDGDVLDPCASPEKRKRWTAMRIRVGMSEEPLALLQGFKELEYREHCDESERIRVSLVAAQAQRRRTFWKWLLGLGA